MENTNKLQNYCTVHFLFKVTLLLNLLISIHTKQLNKQLDSNLWFKFNPYDTHQSSSLIVHTIEFSACNQTSKLNKNSTHLFVLNLNCVRELHGANITGVRTRNGDDCSFRQFIENPIGRLSASLPERRCRRNLSRSRRWGRRRRFHLNIARAASDH